MNSNNDIEPEGVLYGPPPLEEFKPKPIPKEPYQIPHPVIYGPPPGKKLLSRKKFPCFMFLLLLGALLVGVIIYSVWTAFC